MKRCLIRLTDRDGRQTEKWVDLTTASVDDMEHMRQISLKDGQTMDVIKYE